MDTVHPADVLTSETAMLSALGKIARTGHHFLGSTHAVEGDNPEFPGSHTFFTENSCPVCIAKKTLAQMQDVGLYPRDLQEVLDEAVADGRVPDPARRGR